MVSNYFTIEMHLKIRKKGVVSGQQLFYYSNAFENEERDYQWSAIILLEKCFENQEERDC